jgi:DNA-binding transcriptional regulator GbsR (MarR family)
MENDRLRVLEKEQKRYNVLKAVYDWTHGQENQPVDFSDVRQITALSGEEIIQTLEYLKAEKLVKGDFTRGTLIIIYITHAGIKEIEYSIKNPKMPTEHFPNQVFYNYGNLNVSQQAGDGNIVSVNQNLGSSEVDDLVVKLSNLLKSSSIDELDKDVTEAAISKIPELAKQEQSQGVIEKVKNRLDFITETIRKYKPTYDVAKPILLAIYKLFKIPFGG